MKLLKPDKKHSWVIIDIKTGGITSRKVKCPKCSYQESVFRTHNYNFCCNCGVKMSNANEVFKKFE